MPAPEQLSIDANGLTFGALAWGEEGAPLALLVHGYPDSAWTWRHLGPQLAAAGWRAVAPFTRGYAPTEVAPDDSYRVKDLAADVSALHAALGGDERAVLVGHDWGAVTVYGVADADPHRFAKLVSLSIPPTAAILKPFTSLKTLPLGARQGLRSWYFVYNQLPRVEGTLPRVIAKHWRDWSPGYDASEDVRRALEALPDHAHRRAALRYYRNNFQGGILKAFSMKPTAPLLYLHGEQDGCMTAELGTRFPETLPPGSEYQAIPGLGHFPHLEDPVGVGARIEDWIGSPA